MGAKAFRQFLVLNTFLVLLAQLVALVYWHRPSTDYLKDFWKPVEMRIEHGSGEVMESIEPESTLANFQHDIALDHGEPMRLHIERRGNEIRETLYIVARYFLPFIFISLLGFGITLSASLRKQGVVVDRVLKRLRTGDLGAKLPESAFDAGNPLVRTFNEMVGKIDGLVAGLNEAETKRSELLRELAHDIRTPLTSIRFLIETVADTAPELTSENIGEKLTTAEQELDYFEALIGELFLLAQVNALGYQATHEDVDITNLAAVEVERLTRLRAAGRATAKVTLHCERRIEIGGNASMLQRLLRNAIENALFYAREEVQVRLSLDGSKIELKIRDDGKGFSEEALALYGTRRKSRFLDARREGKASLGLGSVIVKAIAAAHGGTAHPGNWRLPSGEIGGGEVTVILPRESTAPVLLAPKFPAAA